MGQTQQRVTSGDVKAAKAARKKEDAKPARGPAKPADVLREELIEKYAADFDVVFPEGAELSDKADALEEHFLKTTPADKRAGCERCKRESPEELPECPFDGDSSWTEDAGPSQEAPPEPAASAFRATAEEASSAIVVDGEETVAQPGSVEELDRAVAEVKTAMGQGAGAFWDLGAKLLAIHDGRLWLRRKADDAEKPLYPTWAKFLDVEFGGAVSAIQSHRAMDIARNLPREHAVLAGVEKASLLIGVKQDARPKLLAQAATTPVLRFRELVREAPPVAERQTGRTPKNAEQFRRMQEASRDKRATKAQETLTLVVKPGRQVLPAYAGTSKDKRAKKLQDEPAALWLCVNGAEVRISVQHGEGGLEFVIVSRRPG